MYVLSQIINEHICPWRRVHVEGRVDMLIVIRMDFCLPTNENAWIEVVNQ